jgi:hypothetical protein
VTQGTSSRSEAQREAIHGLKGGDPHVPRATIHALKEGDPHNPREVIHVVLHTIQREEIHAIRGR